MCDLSLIKEYHNLTPLVEAYRLYRGLEDARDEALELAELSDDPELRSMAAEEAEALKDKLTEAADQLVFARISCERIDLMHTDLPDPVHPPISRCGNVARSNEMSLPSLSCPIINGNV